MSGILLRCMTLSSDIMQHEYRYYHKNFVFCSVVFYVSTSFSIASFLRHLRRGVEESFTFVNEIRMKKGCYQHMLRYSVSIITTCISVTHITGTKFCRMSTLKTLSILLRNKNSLLSYLEKPIA